MIWNKEMQARLDHLRGKELAGTLAGSEQRELAEVGELEQQLATLQGENQELARLLAQQESLAADARRFLVEFDERRAAISDALARFAGGPLPAT